MLHREYTAEVGGPGVRVREKHARRDAKSSTFAARERDVFLTLIAAPRLTGIAEELQDLDEVDGIVDFALIDGDIEFEDAGRFSDDGSLSTCSGNWTLPISAGHATGGLIAPAVRRMLDVAVERSSGDLVPVLRSRRGTSGSPVARSEEVDRDE